MHNLYGYVKCEGSRWYVWNEQDWKWERATIIHGVSHRSVREDDFEEACIWRRHLYHGDIGIQLTPRTSRILRAR